MFKLYAIFFVVVIMIAIAFVLFKYFENKENFTLSGKITLYYSPSCGHCKNFMSTWDKFSEILNNLPNSSIKAEKVNCQQEYCTNIMRFPTVLLARSDGVIVEFKNERTVDALTKFVNENI